MSCCLQIFRDVARKKFRICYFGVQLILAVFLGFRDRKRSIWGLNPETTLKTPMQTFVNEHMHRPTSICTYIYMPMTPFTGSPFVSIPYSMFAPSFETVLLVLLLTASGSS